MTPDNIVEDASKNKKTKIKNKNKTKNKQHQQKKKIFWKAQGSKLNVTEIF